MTMKMMLSKLVTLLLLLPAALLVTTTTAFAYDDHVEEFEIYVNRTERLKAEDTASPGSGSDRFSAPFYLNGSTTKLGTFFDKQIATPISTTATVDHGDILMAFGTDPNTKDIITMRYVQGSDTNVITGGSGKYACARGEATFTADTINNYNRLAITAYTGCKW